MTSLVLEDRRRVLLSELLDYRTLAHRLAYLLFTIVVCGGIYGAVLGSWHGARLALYVAVKVPVLLISTACVTALFNWIIGSLLGLPLTLRQTFALTMLPLAIAALVAASLAPVVWLFTTSLPEPYPTQRTLHNLLYLIHTMTLSLAGLAGTTCLREALPSRNVRYLWIAVYAFVAGELAWILRPFIGSVYLPVVFVRDDALNGNVYEFIATDILPHLFRTLCN